MIESQGCKKCQQDKNAEDRFPDKAETGSQANRAAAATSDTGSRPDRAAVSRNAFTAANVLIQGVGGDKGWVRVGGIVGGDPEFLTESLKVKTVWNEGEGGDGDVPCGCIYKNYASDVIQLHVNVNELQTNEDGERKPERNRTTTATQRETQRHTCRQTERAMRAVTGPD